MSVVERVESHAVKPRTRSDGRPDRKAGPKGAGRGAPGFATELQGAIEPVQAALRELLEEWGSPASATELMRLSGADRTICWRVFRVAYAEDVAAEAKNVPSPAYLKKLLAAAESAGISGDTIRAVVEAAEGFQRFIKGTATDRAAFVTMTAGVSSDTGGEKILSAQRRAVYRGQSHVSGVQTDLQYQSAILMRSAAGGTDTLALTTQRGLRRLRPEARLPLYAYHTNPSGKPGVVEVEGAIDPEAAAKYGLPLLPRFSKRPFPEVERWPLTAGFCMHNVAGREVGAKSDLDFSIGTYKENAALMTDADAGGGERRLYHLSFAYTRKPVALGVHEVLVHRESLKGVKPELMVYQYTEGMVSQEAARNAQQYPLEERLMRLGRADNATLDEIPWYGEMVRYATGLKGWDLKEFDVWRVRIPYPILNSMVRIWFYVE